MDGLEALAASLDDAADRMPREAEKVVSKGALNIKTGVRSAWRNLQHTPRLYLTVGYDVTRLGDRVTAEIGPDVSMSYQGGPLGGVIEYGTVNNAPRPALGPELLKESPRFTDALAAAAQSLLDD